jgi:hypothetical protein
MIPIVMITAAISQAMQAQKPAKTSQIRLRTSFTGANPNGPNQERRGGSQRDREGTEAPRKRAFLTSADLLQPVRGRTGDRSASRLQRQIRLFQQPEEKCARLDSNQ